MAIKYYKIPEKKITIGVLNGCQYDVGNKIAKLTADLNIDVFSCDEKYLMPDTFRAIVRCHDDDVFDEEEGERQVKEKLMKKYYRSFDKRMAMFKKHIECLDEKIEMSMQKRV